MFQMEKGQWDTTLDLSRMNMAATQINASVRTSTTPSLVNFFINISNPNLHSGDIAISGKTVHKFMKISSDSNAAIWKAYPDSKVDLWDQNLVNGEYVIAYELSRGLDRKLQNMLPKVNCQLFLIFFDAVICHVI